MSRIAQPRLMLLHLAFAAVGAWAQPQVNAVTNGADYTPTIAPGSIATVFGTGLAPSQEYPSGLPLPMLLNGVSVTVNGRQAGLFYVSDTQINFQVPLDTPGSAATLYVNNGGQQSNGLQCAVASSTLGIFQAGGGYGAIQNPGLSQNSSTNPAPAGSVIVVYITGIGLTDVTVPNRHAVAGLATGKICGHGYRNHRRRRRAHPVHRVDAWVCRFRASQHRDSGSSLGHLSDVDIVEWNSKRIGAGVRQGNRQRLSIHGSSEAGEQFFTSRSWRYRGSRNQRRGG